MVQTRVLLFFGAALCAQSAFAADALKFGAAPAWVVPQTIPAVSDKVKDKPVALLLHDQQIMLEPGKISTYSELAYKIQKPEGLAAGNLSITWNPAFDTATVNRLEIRRGNQVIDVLKSGQTFTTMRRESNLELAMLDGVLTANIQPEALQQGDVIVLATTLEHVDPTLKGHVEAGFAPWGQAQIGLAHARINWPANLQVKVQKSGDLPSAVQGARDGRKLYELTMHDVEPVVPPNGAPLRFKIGRLGEASDFRSWADAAHLMAPLYRDASVIPTTGPLRDEVEKIRKVSSDQKIRAQQALALVQDRVRYVALSMGDAGLVPASAETTWSRRFGDCKGKTALLLAILHEYGISAEPVLVNAFAGDAVADWLPMIGVFNHVLVRAHIDGKDYWLDGTRTGDTDLDSIEVPNFGWGLPLVQNATLVRITPAPPQVPYVERHVAVDASTGVFAPAAVSIDELYRGDSAVAYNASYSAMTGEQRNQQMHDEAKGYFDSFTIASSSFEFDKAKREFHINIKGTAKLNWKDGWLDVPTSSIAFDPDFDRPAGPLHDVPWSVDYRNFVKDEATIRFPPGFATQQKLSPEVHERLAGVEYARSESINGDVLTVDSSARGVAQEIPYKEALAAEQRLRALSKDDVYIRLPASYRISEKDAAALPSTAPASADEFIERGNLYLNARQYDPAIADYTAALKLDSGSKWALADRGLSYVWKRQFDEAEKDLAAAEKLDPANAVVLRARGLMAEEKTDCKTAVDEYTKSLQLEPSDSFALGHRAICEAFLDKKEDALADSERALKMDPSYMDLRVIRANIFFREGKRDLVAAEADTIVQDNPKSVFAFVAAAQTYAAIGQRNKAMELFERALAIKPTALIYVNRSQVRPPSDISGKMADLDEALKLEPNQADAMALKAELLSKEGKHADALSLLDRLPKTPVNEAWLASLRGILLYKAGQVTNARAEFAGLESKAKTANDFNNLCWTKATLGIMLDSALEDCRQALKLSPETGAYVDSLGMTLLKLGRLDEALDAYNRAVAKDTGANSLMGRAFVYLRKGDKAHAEADAAAARKQYPDIDTVFAEYGLKFGADQKLSNNAGK